MSSPELHTSGVIYYVLFCIWLLWFSIIFMRFVYVLHVFLVCRYLLLSHMSLYQWTTINPFSCSWTFCLPNFGLICIVYVYVYVYVLVYVYWYVYVYMLYELWSIYAQFIMYFSHSFTLSCIEKCRKFLYLSFVSIPFYYVLTFIYIYSLIFLYIHICIYK